MSLMIGPAFTIPGYTTTVPPDYDTECDATVYAADGLVDYTAFWAAYLFGALCLFEESKTAFEVNAEEHLAVRAVLDDPDRWPALSVRLEGDAWLRIVYRNFEGDVGLDFVNQRPGLPVSVYTAIEDRGSSPLAWQDLLDLAQLPDERLSWAQRMILISPMLDPQELPADAVDVLERALKEIGASNRPALVAALVCRLDWSTH